MPFKIFVLISLVTSSVPCSLDIPFPEFSHRLRGTLTELVSELLFFLRLWRWCYNGSVQGRYGNIIWLLRYFGDDYQYSFIWQKLYMSLRLHNSLLTSGSSNWMTKSCTSWSLSCRIFFKWLTELRASVILVFWHCQDPAQHKTTYSMRTKIQMQLDWSQCARINQ